MVFTLIISINEDVIKVDNNKNFEFFGNNLIDIALKTG